MAEVLAAAAGVMDDRGELLHQLCTRNRAGRPEAVRVDELASIACRAGQDGERMSDLAYARYIVRAVRRTIAAVPAQSGCRMANAYLADAEVRRRFDLALSGLSRDELRAIAAELLASPEVAPEQLRYLRDCVERLGNHADERARLGRRFAILCEAVAARVPRISDADVLEGMYGWDWDARLSPHRDGQAARPAFAAAAYRALRHFVVRAFGPQATARDRVREARGSLASAASTFMQAYEQGIAHWKASPPEAASYAPRTPNDLMRAPTQALRLALSSFTRARERYEAESVALGEPVQYARTCEMAFGDAASRLSGDVVDALGRYCVYWGACPFGREYGEPVRHMRNALRAECATRAATEIVRALVRHVALRESAPIVRADQPEPAALRAREDLMRHVRALDQRFRLRDGMPGVRATYTMRDFMRAGVMRVSPQERQRLHDLICHPEWRPPEWLANDELWLGIVRAFQ